MKKADPVKRADPSDDPEVPESIERLDPSYWLERIQQAMLSGEPKFAQVLAMTYASDVVRRHVLLEPEDSELRDRGYRYLQVNKNNWELILESNGYPIPELPSAITIESGDFGHVGKTNVFAVVSLDEVTEDRRREIERKRQALPPR